MTEYNQDNQDWDDESDFSASPVAVNKWWDVIGVWLRPWRVGKDVALEEWLTYYSGLYANRGPDVERFERLVKRNGMWNAPNPFREGNAQFYTLCEDGVFLADVDFLLGRWQKKLYPRQLPEQELAVVAQTEEDRIQQKISSIAQNWAVLYEHQPHMLPGQSIAMTELNNLKEWGQQQKVWEQHAKKCLRVLFAQPSKYWIWMGNVLHADNIRLLCKIVYDGAPLAEQKRLFDNWCAAKWLSEQEKKWFATSQ